MLSHGVWGGKQIVPAEFLEQATTPQIIGQGLYFYGYRFWLGRSFISGGEIDWIAAFGLGGQRIYVVPTLDLVAVVNAGLYRSPLQAWVLLAVLNRTYSRRCPVALSQRMTVGAWIGGCGRD